MPDLLFSQPLSTQILTSLKAYKGKYIKRFKNSEEKFTYAFAVYLSRDRNSNARKLIQIRKQCEGIAIWLKSLNGLTQFHNTLLQHLYASYNPIYRTALKDAFEKNDKEVPDPVKALIKSITATQHAIDEHLDMSKSNRGQPHKFHLDFLANEIATILKVGGINPTSSRKGPFWIIFESILNHYEIKNVKVREYIERVCAK
jgi:hypothetical protein